MKKFARGPMLNPKDYHVYARKDEKNATEMIGVDEGFCYLTHVAGKFEGGGEAVWIDIRGASWYLGAKTNQVDMNVRARCWKWPSMEK